MKKITFLVALILAAGNAVAQQPVAPAAPTSRVEQPPVDPRFASWLGCWRLNDDLTGTGARMCITPEKDGVRLQTVVGTNKGIDEHVIPDGVSRPISDPECKGNEQAEWSKDGARIFRTTNVTCGKEPARTIKTVAFLAPGPAWVYVQHVIGDSAAASVRVQRYRRAVNQNLADGSRAPQPDSIAARVTPEQTQWSVEDVIEASDKLPVAAIQAALTELHHGFDLNKKTLIALDDGGVNESVIDLMVALTYPKKFVVERASGGSAASGVSTGSGWFDPFLSAQYATPLMNCYTPYGYGYRSYYSMCGPGYYGSYGYNYYGYGYPYYPYYPGGGWVDVGVNPPITGGPIAPQPEGRVVNGHGYTQIRDRQPEPSPRINSSGNGSGWNGNSGGASSSGYSSGSSNSGSSGGGSGGGDSGARIAVPKGGGQ
jgi:uncharacterized membrane protein YgcG